MNKSSGFTLIELIVVVALVAILTTIATPSLHAMVRNNQAAAETNQLVSALNIARSEAIKRGAKVSLCALAGNGNACSSGKGDWSQGWLVFTDFAGNGSYSASSDEILQVFPALSSGSVLKPEQGAATVTFGASGFLDLNANTSSVVFELSISGCTGDENRRIEINLQGRTSTVRESCKG